MDIQEMNVMLAETLRRWDPFQEGGEFYDTEVADCLMAMRDVETSHELADEIQRIYEFSFDEKLNWDSCHVIAQELLAIRNHASCKLS